MAGRAVRSTFSVLVQVALVHAVSAASMSALQSTGAEGLSVELAGVDGAVRENVQASLTIFQQRDRELSRGDIRRMHERAAGEIQQALRPFGYYHPDLTQELVHENGQWTAQYRIDPGPPVVVEELDIQLSGPGEADPFFREAVAAFPLSQGDALHHGAHEEGRMRLERVAQERGYFASSFAARTVPVDLEANTARVILHLETGERHRFGAVRFEQEDFSEELLEGFVPFEQGDVFHLRELLEFQNALAGSGLFQIVNVDAREAEAENLEVPIVVILEPLPRLEYAIGLGYGTDTGTRGSLAWEIRRLNRRGHQLRGDIRASFVRRAIQTRYTIPYGGAGEEWLFTASFRDDDVATYRGQTLSLGTSLSQERWGWRETLYLNIIRAWFEVGAVEGVTTLVLPGAEWSRTRYNDRIYPTRGDRIAFETRGTDPVLGSHVSFVQGTLRGNLIRPAGASGRLLGRTELGATWVDDFARLPGTYRYFAGGDRSIRGFGFQALGPPTEDEHTTVGGRHLLTASVEYEHLFGDTWGAAVFYDVGNAVNRLDDRLEQGTGVGARWISPIGMVRVDVATQLSRSGIPLRLHVTLGPDL